MSGFGYNVLGFGANSSGGGEVLPSDDQFNRVSFLSHFDGANNGVNNVFDDGSANNYTVTAAGNVTQGSFGPFARPDGDWGVSFDGGSYVTSNYLQVAESSDFDFGTGDFTVEFFFFNREYGAYYDYLVTFGNSTTTTSSFGIYIDGGTSINLWQNSAAIASSTSYNTNQWYHLAVVRASGTVKFYLDGSEIKSASFSSDISSPGGMNVANWRLASDSQYFNGIISNLRVVKGTAVYTGNFTAPTSKLTAITNTVLLTCQSNRFLDNSATGHTVAPEVSPAVTAFGPFLTSAVYDAAVNGASSSPLDYQTYLSIADGAWKTLGTGDFTWEFWFYGKTESLYMVGDATSTQNISSTFTLGVSSKRLTLYYSIQGEQAYPLQSPNSAPFYNLNEWHHVAYVRDGNDHKIYADGILRASETRSGTMVDSTGAQHIGNFGAGYSSGSNTIFSDVRLVKGTAVYSGSTYTVPTAPLTAISGTELLVNFKDAQAIDSAAQNNITLGGNANTSTDQAKFGDTSLHLDGTTDYAEIVNVQGFGKGDFTIEGFYRFASFTSQGDVFDFRTALNSALPLLYLNNSGELKYYLSGALRIEAGSSNELSTNTWYHIALCRGSGSTKLFVDGTQVGSTYSDSITYLTAPIVRIGARSYGTPDQNIDGFVDEFRISRTARYTSNFTAPTAAFADKGQ